MKVGSEVASYISAYCTHIDVTAVTLCAIRQKYTSVECYQLLCDHTLSSVFAHTKMNNTRSAAETGCTTTTLYHLHAAMSLQQATEA